MEQVSTVQAAIAKEPLVALGDYAIFWRDRFRLIQRAELRGEWGRTRIKANISSSMWGLGLVRGFVGRAVCSHLIAP